MPRRIREVPPPRPIPALNLLRLRFDKRDRIVMDGLDHKWVELTAYGYVFERADDPDITIAKTPGEMEVVRRRPDYRHDRNWYSKGAVKARLRAGVASLSDLPWKQRIRILYKRDFVMMFLDLEAAGEVTRGDDALEDVIPVIDNTLKTRASEEADQGRRPRAMREKITFDPPCGKTLLDWTTRLVEAEFDPIILRNRTDLSGNFNPKITKEEKRILERIAERYMCPTEPTATLLHEDMALKIRRLNRLRAKANLPALKTPSYNRLLEEIGKLPKFDVMAARKGIELAMKRFSPVGDGMDGIARPLQHCEMDHWSIQLVTLCKEAGFYDQLPKDLKEKIDRERRQLGVMICRRTRCIVAMQLSKEANSESVVALVEMALYDKWEFAGGADCLTPWDIYGLIGTIFSDGGSAFANLIVKPLLDELKIKFERNGEASLRGTVERIFRTIHKRLIARFEGRTFENVVARGEYDAEGRAGLTVDELAWVLVRWTVDIYHNTPHVALGWETPRQCFLRLTKDEGVDPPPDPDKRRHIFGIEIQCTLSAAGLRFLNVQYRSRKLHEHFLKVGNAVIDVRVHPSDMGAISARVGDDWLTVLGPKEFHGVEAEAWIEYEADLRRRGHQTEELLAPVVGPALEALNGKAARARRRAGIENNIITKEKLLLAERQMMIGVRFPDEPSSVDATATPDLHAGAIKVGTPAPRVPASQDPPAKDATTNPAPTPAPATRRTTRPKNWSME